MVINIRQGTAEDGSFILKNNIPITNRELETLALIGIGFSNSEAARKMSVTVNTVRSHIWNIMKKMGATSRANAIVLAVQNGFIDIRPKKSLDAHVPGFDKYVLCIFCGKVSLEADYKDETTEQVVINHIEYEIPVLPGCPTEGCSGNINETIDWDYMRQYHLEYPEVPNPGVEYDYDIRWYHGHPEHY